MASLLALSRAASEETKRLFTLTVWAHGISLALAAVALRFTSPWDHVCVVLALVVELLAWGMRSWAGRTHSQAEGARRSAMLMWAFGETNEPLDAVDLRSSFSPRVESRAADLEDPNYYSSTLPPGRDRFVDMFQESAFWSKHLYRLAGWLAMAACGLALLAAVLLFVLLERTGVAGILPVLAEVMVPIITFFISVDLLGQGLAWLEAAGTSDRIDHALEGARAKSEADLLATFTDYGVATASASPIPTFLYRRQHDRLDREWRRRRGVS
jgi:hypothetical protein